MARLTDEQVADLRRQFDRYMGGRINTVTGKREWDTFYGLPIPALIADLEEARRERDEARTELASIKPEWEKFADIVETLGIEDADDDPVVAVQSLMTEAELANQELDKARAALRAVEWDGSDQENCCPCCGNWKSEGHVDDCLVGNALAASEEKP